MSATRRQRRTAARRQAKQDGGGDFPGFGPKELELSPERLKIYDDIVYARIFALPNPMPGLWTHFESLKQEKDKKVHPHPYQFLCRRIFAGKWVGKVEVRPSPVHGRGVFAISPIKAGELITFYPGDLVRIDLTEDGERWWVNGLDLEMIKRLEEVGPSRDYLMEYLYTLAPPLSVIGNPTKDQDPTYVGHLINDAVRSRGPADIDIYTKISLAKMNAAFVPIYDYQVAVVAQRDIAPGEEIFTSYQIGFWRDRWSEQDS